MLKNVILLPSSVLANLFKENHGLNPQSSIILPCLGSLPQFFKLRGGDWDPTWACCGFVSAPPPLLFYFIFKWYFSFSFGSHYSLILNLWNSCGWCQSGPMPSQPSNSNTMILTYFTIPGAHLPLDLSKMWFYKSYFLIIKELQPSYFRAESSAFYTDKFHFVRPRCH